jgi:hypothetical protein
VHLHFYVSALIAVSAVYALSMIGVSYLYLLPPYAAA